MSAKLSSCFSSSTPALLLPLYLSSTSLQLLLQAYFLQAYLLQAYLLQAYLLQASTPAALLQQLYSTAPTALSNSTLLQQQALLTTALYTLLPPLQRLLQDLLSQQFYSEAPNMITKGALAPLLHGVVALRKQRHTAVRLQL